MSFKPDQQMTTYAEIGLAPDHGQIDAGESLIGLHTRLIAAIAAAQGLLEAPCWIEVSSSRAPDSVRIMLCCSCLPPAQ
jgi:hypothetical protein